MTFYKWPEGAKGMKPSIYVTRKAFQAEENNSEFWVGSMHLLLLITIQGSMDNDFKHIHEPKIIY